MQRDETNAGGKDRVTRGRRLAIRILHIVASGKRRGAELFASDLVRTLGKEDVAQRVVVLRGSEPVEVHFAATTDILHAGRRLIPGFRIDLRAVRALRHIIGQWRPNVIQAHGGEALKYSACATIGRHARIVYRRIGAAPPWMTRWHRKVAHRTLLRRAACVVAVAESLRQETVKLFGIHNVVTIPNAVDPRRMRTSRDPRITRAQFGISPSSPVLLSIGALTWEKDPLTHLQVSERVAAELPDVVHLIVGDGPMRAELQEVIHARSMMNRVQILGSRTDVPDLLAASDVLLFASRPDGMEGMPAVLIEAGLMGVALVGYDIVGVSEVVLNGETGVLVPHGRVGDLAASVLDLLRHPERREAMGAAAQVRCRSHFDIETVSNEYLETYRQLVG
jgi:L-malate glycosyltransferase